MPLLQVKNLCTYFKKDAGALSKLFGRGTKIVRAVDGVSFNIEEREIFGLVGESGCGKTTVGNSVLRLVEPTSGKIFFEGEDLLNMGDKELHKFRLKAQLISQNARSSLNPRMNVGEILSEPFEIHKLTNYEDEIEEKVRNLLKIVGLSPYDVNKYPHEFSGGEARRITVARALALHPKLVVADEPTSGLDVSIMAQVINLMVEMQDKFGLTYLWISHNLHIVRHIADRLAVMYLGKIVEMGSGEEIFQNPLHPYTQALFSSVPDVMSKKKEKIILEGEVPSPINPPLGCRFGPRCWRVNSLCKNKEPKLVEIENCHWVACHRCET